MTWFARENTSVNNYNIRVHNNAIENKVMYDIT